MLAKNSDARRVQWTATQTPQRRTTMSLKLTVGSATASDMDCVARIISRIPEAVLSAYILGAILSLSPNTEQSEKSSTGSKIS